MDNDDPEYRTLFPLYPVPEILKLSVPVLTPARQSVNLTVIPLTVNLI